MILKDYMRKMKTRFWGDILDVSLDAGREAWSIRLCARESRRCWAADSEERDTW